MTEDFKPVEHAASVLRITNAEKALGGAKSKNQHEADYAEFKEALKAHEDVFGKPFKRNGGWQ